VRRKGDGRIERSRERGGTWLKINNPGVESPGGQPKFHGCAKNDSLYYLAIIFLDFHNPVRNYS
jgi:hypothetical protein